MVRRKGILQVVLLTLVVVLVATPALAASVATATFRGDLVCYNSSGDTLSNTCSAFNINTQALIGGDFVTEDLLNTAVQTPGGSDVAYMPGVGTNPWIIYSGTIDPYEQKSTFFFTGGPAMQTGFSYFPLDGGMTTPDSGSLELGDNFEIEVKGNIDTSSGADKNLVYKEDAFRLFISDAGEITAIMTDAPADAYYDPTADGSISENTLLGGSVRWIAMQDDSYSTYLRSAYSTQWTDLFTNTAIYSDRRPYDIIHSVKVYWEARENVDNCEGNAAIYIDGIQYNVSQANYTADWVWRYDSWNYNPEASFQKWEVSDLEGFEFGFMQHEDGGYNAYTAETYVVINYTARPTVIASGISSGVHTIKVTADGTNLKIYVDDVEKDSATLEGDSVADNTRNWAFLQNGSMIYMDYHKISVGGTLKQHIIYQRDTTFTDQAIDSGTADSGTTTTLVDDVLTQADNYWNNIILEIVTTTDGEAPQGESATVTDFTAADDTLHFAALTAAVEAGDTYELRNDATPTFRTTSSDASISTTFDNYGPISEAVATITATEDIPGPLDDVTPTMPPEMYGELNTEQLPGASLINEMLGVGGIPQALFWIPFVFGLAALAVLIAYKFARSMLVIFTVGLCIVVFFALTGGGVVSFWAVIEYVVIGMALLVAEKHMAW